jgi:hypothetical protein
MIICSHRFGIFYAIGIDENIKRLRHPTRHPPPLRFLLSFERIIKLIVKKVEGPDLPQGLF